ncbi:MAG: tRNA 5-hydroxyuridine modification protein YegQ [Xanthomonadaceae bacterium]|jgi:putative protease|nr:tRNA 5-hydroxyuridine modification protein YegQ [Xanthomonadaceae bacterium]
MTNAHFKRPELLSPAGSMKSLRYALAYGADAIYAGLPRYSLRARNNEFRNLQVIEAGIRYARAAGKKFLLTVNLMPRNRKVDTFIRDLAPVVELRPDALIMSDPGLIMMVRQQWPDMPIHLSVQANTMNYASVRFWQRLGVARIILSRELSIGEIAEIRQQCPDIELEVFVHGALCIAYSGRCLLSGYFNHRDANQGTCTNACRWQYRIADAAETPEGTLLPLQENGVIARHPAAGKAYVIEETGRRHDQWMEIDEDEHGTYIMNSRDLRAIRHVQKLVEVGIDCLKIEGRTKSHYYTARTAQIYRQAIDDAMAGREFDRSLLAQLDGLANRGYTEGFYDRHSNDETQNYADGSSNVFTQQFVAEVLDYDLATGLSTVEVKNRFAVRDTLEVITPKGTRRCELKILQNQEGEFIDVAPGSGHIVRVDIGETDLTTLVARNL